MRAGARHDGTTVLTDGTYSPRRSASGMVRLPEPVNPGSWARTVIGAVVVLGTLAVLAGVILTATVAAATPQSGQLIITLRGTFPDTAVPANSTIVTTAGDRDLSWTGRLTGVAGIPSTSTVTVIAGPYGKVDRSAAGTLTVNGADTGLTGTAPTVLDRQYLAVCVAGACRDAGQRTVIVPARSVLGTPWLTLSPLPSGWRNPTVTEQP